MLNLNIVKTLFLSTLLINYVYADGQCYTTEEWNSKYGGQAYEGGWCSIDHRVYEYLVCDTKGSGKRLQCKDTTIGQFRRETRWEAISGDCVQKNGQWCTPSN